MRYLPIIALLMFSLVVACGGEPAVREPAATESQASMGEPAVTSVTETEEATTGDTVPGTDQAVDEPAPAAEPTPGGEAARQTKAGTPPVQPAEGNAPVAKEPASALTDAGEEAPTEAVTPAQVSLEAEGGAIFGRRCATCHAKDGSGDTAMGRRQGIPNFASAEVQELSDEDLLKLMREGSGAVSKQAHQNKLQNDHEIRAVLAWIRSLG